MTNIEQAPEATVSQVYEYCCQAFNLMESEAKLVEPDDGGDTMAVWEGFFTRLITERIGLAVPYFSTVRRELMRMGCIRQLRRGGGSSPSQWELLQSPTEELWHSAPAKKQHAGTKTEANSGAIKDLARRLARIEENFEVLMQALAETANKPGGLKVAFEEPKPAEHTRIIEQRRKED